MQEFWREFFASPEYTDNCKKRVLDGKAPHIESFWVNKLEGKPVEKHEHSGPGGGPIPYAWDQ